MTRPTSTSGCKNAAKTTTAAQNVCLGKSSIERAIERARTRANFAAILGVMPQAVCQWLRRGWVPPKRAVAIETIFGIDRRRTINPDLNSPAADIL